VAAFEIAELTNKTIPSPMLLIIFCMVSPFFAIFIKVIATAWRYAEA
jgi:hypothetical protein